MKRSLIFLAAILVVAFAGCGDEPTPMDTTVTLDEVGPPATSGIIVRDGFPIGVTWIDADAGLRVVLGANMDEFCAGIIDFDVIDYQTAYLRDGRIVDLGKGVVQATVWDFLDFDCALFTTMDPVASGLAKIVSVDNDLEGIAEGDTNTNSWAFMAHGRLMGMNGDPMQFSGHIRQVFGINSGYHVNSQINLK